MNKFKLMLALLAAPSMVLASCGDDPAPEVEKKITKVSVSCSKKTLGVGDTVKASANVTAEGGAEKSVTWSSDNESVATVDSSTGKITAKAPGSAKITATSTFDASKSGSVTITVINEGWEPAFCDAGYEFKEAFPVEEFKKFTGASDVYSPSVASEGVYFQKFAESDESVAYLEIVLKIDAYEDEDGYYDLLDELDASGKFHYEYDSVYYCDMYFDNAKSYEMDVVSAYGDEEGEICYIALDVYKTEDLYYGDTLTSATDWSEEEKQGMSSAIGMVLPFVKLGEEYMVEADEEYEEVMIGDWSLAFDALDNYGEVLKAAGFAYSEEDDAYSKAVNDYSMIMVQFYWCSYGNFIDAFLTDRVYEECPINLMNKYISEEIGSKYQAINMDFADANQYVFRVLEADEEEGVPHDCGEIGAMPVDLDSFKAYAKLYEDAGFKLITHDEWDEEEMETEYYNFEKGKLGVTLELVPSYEIDWDAMEIIYNIDNATAYLDCYEVVGGREDPGLYYDGKDVVVQPGADSGKIVVDAFELGESPVIAFSSSNEAVATVDASTGVVHGVAEGEAVITASTTYDSKEYKVEIKVKVINQITEKVVMADKFEGSSTGPVSIKDSVITTDAGTKISFAVGTNASKQNPQFQASDGTARVYVGNTMTITAPEGMSVLGVNIVGVGSNGGTLAADSGTLTAVEGGYSWEGDAASVNFNCATSKHYRITSVEIIVG